MIRALLNRITRHRPQSESLDAMASRMMDNRYSRPFIQRLQADVVLQQDEWTFIGRAR